MHKCSRENHTWVHLNVHSAREQEGKGNVFSLRLVCLCVFSKHFLTTRLHHLSISIHVSARKRGLGHFQGGFKKNQTFVSV